MRAVTAADINVEEILTHDDDSFRGGKLCKCCDCGVVEICSPQFDFYSTAKSEPLRCEACFNKHMGLPTMKPTRELSRQQIAFLIAESEQTN